MQGQKERILMELKVINIRQSNTGSIVKAFIDINYYGLIIKGCRLVEGSNGTFIGYPGEKGKDGKYYDIIYPDNITLKSNIEKVLIEEYKKHFLSKLE